MLDPEAGAHPRPTGGVEGESRFAILAPPAAKSTLPSGPACGRNRSSQPPGQRPASADAPARPFRFKPRPTGLARGPTPPRDRRRVLSAPAAGRSTPRRSEVTDGAGLRWAEGQREDGGRGRILAPPPPILEPAQMRRLGWGQRRVATGAGGDPGSGAWP